MVVPAPVPEPLARHRLHQPAMSANTRRAYQSALHRLDAWLSGRDLTDAALADYLAFLYDAGRGYGGAAQLVAAVRRVFQESGIPSPEGRRTARALENYRRNGGGRGAGQVGGVRWEHADLASHLAAQEGSLTGLRDAALLAVASDALLRVSEVAALEVADLDLQPDGTGRLIVRRSKTDQAAAGSEPLFLGEGTAARLETWLTAAGIDSGPVFRRLRRGGRVEGRLSDRSVRAIITRRAQAAGVSGRVSGHSLRVGAAQSLAASGAGVVEMQTAGRWASPRMPAHYAAGELAARGAVARYRYGR